MAGDAFLGKFHRFLRLLTCAGRSELPEQCLPVWAEANVAWAEPCETIDIQLSWLTNMTIRTVRPVYPSQRLINAQNVAADRNSAAVCAAFWEWEPHSHFNFNLQCKFKCNNVH